jgi:hypothetical protein
VINVDFDEENPGGEAESYDDDSGQVMDLDYPEEEVLDDDEEDDL